MAAYLVALSGGADSVALLLYMLEQNLVGAAAHCNFRLRGKESDRDEIFVRNLCREKEVTLHVAHFDTYAEADRTGESIEMAARRLRYDWFDHLCKEQGYKAVAVAHHRNDNAETLLLNLIRGTGLHGLTGMAANRTGVVRPLLNWSRSQILEFLTQHKQDYVTDSTNADTIYRRNKIRHELIPLLRTMNPRIEKTLHETTQRLAEAERIYAIGLQHVLESVVLCSRSDGGVEIDVEKLHSTGVENTLLHELLSPHGFTAAQLLESLTLRTGGMLEAGDWLLTRTAQTLIAAPRPYMLEKLLTVPTADGLFAEINGMHIGVRYLQRDSSFSIPRTPHMVALDADCLVGNVVLRSVCQGDRFAPFGMRGTQLISDYLTNRRCSRIDKLAALVLADNQGIVWLVGERPDRRAIITDKTTRIVLFYIEKQ